MKRKTLLFFGVLAVAPLLQSPASAQSTRRGGISFQQRAETGQVTRDQVSAEQDSPFRKALTSFPGSRKDASKASRETVASVQSPFAAPKVQRKGNQWKINAASGSDILVNVVYEPGMTSYNDRSIAQMDAASPKDYSKLVKGDYVFENGTGIVDNLYYGCRIFTVNTGGNYPSIYTFDMNTWEVIEADYPENDFSLMALETAMAADGTVYGEFYNTDASGRELGTVDYANRTRTTFGTTRKYYCAMGITKAGVLYGIAIDGNLYKINTETGAEELVGATGVTVANPQGYYYRQTGEIDQRDDTFYWLGTDYSTESTALYTVNLETGAATKHYDFGEYIFAGMLIPQINAAPEVPNMVENVTANFENGALSGNIVFTTPTQTFGGETLSGPLTFSVKVNDVEVASGRVDVGVQISVPVSVTEGMQTFSVTTSNSAGESPAVRVRQWVGNDTPEEVTDVQLSIDNATGQATLNWVASVAGKHGGYIGGLCYDVYRITAEKEERVAQGLDVTTFTEVLPKVGIVGYKYGVVACNGTHNSNPAYSNQVMLGDAFPVPYQEDFSSALNFSIWTTLDVNNDKEESSFGLRGVWSRDQTQNAAAYIFGRGTADDWLISPPIKLHAGRTYMISLQAKARAAGSKTYPEKFEVKLGKAATAEAMTTTIIPVTEVTSVDYQTYDNLAVTVDETGDYNIGIHALSTEDGWTLYINSLEVDVATVPTAPEPVRELKAAAATGGKLEATVSFRTPSKNMQGDALSEPLSKVEIYRDQILVHTFQQAALDTELSWTDVQGLSNGWHTYRVIPYCGEDAGPKAEIRTYVGVDVPGRVNNIRVRDEQTSVTVMWDKVGSTGASGGLVIPEDVDYLVWSTFSFGGAHMLNQLKATVHDDTSVRLEFDTNEGEQREESWAVQARNVAGTGEAYMKSILVGAPYSLPFKETVTGGEMSNYWDLQRTSGAVSIGLSNESSDGDGYAFQLLSTAPEEDAELYSGKISVADAANPMLTFDLKGNPAGNSVGIYAVRPGGVEKMLGIVNVTDEFKSHKISLKDYKDENFIRLAFIGSFDQAGSIVFDNVNVLDMLQNNLAVSDIEAPITLQAGETGKVRVRVRNIGDAAVGNYVVKVMAGSRELLSQTVSEPLPSMSNREFEMDYPTTIFDAAGEVAVTAQVIFDADMDMQDNEKSTTVRLTASAYTPPTNFTANPGEGCVELAWEQPSMMTRQVTESFENTEIFPAFSIGGITTSERHGTFGDWALYDGDGAITSAWVVSYENSGKEHAWQVINPRLVFGPNTYEADLAYDGEQYLIAFCARGANSDDWIISPELPGVAQTVTYYVRSLTDYYGKEEYEVLYSTTDNDPTSFQRIGLPRTPTILWEGNTFDLPAGTKYFAIRHTSAPAFGMLLDAITYTTEGGEVSAYNVYVDGNLVATLDGTQKTYQVPGLSEDDKRRFSITAVYDDGGESAPVTIGLSTAIGLITMDGQPMNVYSIDGRLVRRNATTLKDLHGIYIVNGRKVVLP